MIPYDSPFGFSRSFRVEGFSMIRPATKYEPTSLPAGFAGDLLRAVAVAVLVFDTSGVNASKTWSRQTGLTLLAGIGNKVKLKHIEAASHLQMFKPAAWIIRIGDGHRNIYVKHVDIAKPKSVSVKWVLMLLATMQCSKSTKPHQVKLHIMSCIRVYACPQEVVVIIDDQQWSSMTIRHLPRLHPFKAQSRLKWWCFMIFLCYHHDHHWKIMENINPSQPQPQPPFHLFVLAEGPWMGEPHRCCRWIASTPKPSWDSAAVEGWPLWGSGQPGQSPGGVKAEGLGMEGLGACAEFNQKMCLGSSLPSGVVEKGWKRFKDHQFPSPFRVPLPTHEAFGWALGAGDAEWKHNRTLAKPARWFPSNVHQLNLLYLNVVQICANDNHSIPNVDLTRSMENLGNFASGLAGHPNHPSSITPALTD